METAIPWTRVKRLHDKAIILGFAPTTRHLAPFDDPSYDLWTLNEEYIFDWVKRTPDYHFQIHPRWDFTRTNNMNDPNHPLWLANKDGACMRCDGKGMLGETKCPHCQDGLYTPPPYRKNLPIFMQQHWDDIPNSIAFPLKEATDLLPVDYPYFTSSVALILILTYLMGYKRVELYGFDMGTTTEYHYQRANGEYIMGFLQGKGMEIYVPPESSLLKGELYGFRNMKTGFRQNLEMRKQILEMQDKEQGSKVNVMTGEIQTLQGLVAEGYSGLAPRLEERSKEYMKALGTHNVVKGALAETKNLTSLYDSYFTAGTEEGKVLSGEEVAQFTNAQYNQ
jgi:hypothetical protein